jgi:outer membrane immunogenic protein
MNKALIGTAAAVALLIGMPALAADMAIKAPPAPVVAPAYNWTGFYVGGNVGYGWGTANNNLSVSQGVGLLGLPGIYVLNGTDSNKPRGVIGGAQAGYNLQSRNFLLGVEADIQASGQSASGAYNSAVLPIGILGTPPGPTPTSVSDSSKLDWFGTVRGRLGITSDRWLLYATGGLAYGEVKESGSAQPANPFPGTTFNAPFQWGQSTTKVGWTIGAGIENALSSNWSWKIEYLYMDLGNVTSNVSGGIGNTVGFATPVNCYGTLAGCTFAAAPAQGSVTSRFTDSIVRVGVNYKFN